MANAKKNQKAAAMEVALETVTQQAAEVDDSTAESNPAMEAPDAAEKPIETAVEGASEKVKRERSYSQSAINTADLERLTQLKTFVKEKLNVSVSNQRIISAALDYLGENVEGFLKSIAADANSKQIEKDRKAYDVLKARFEASEKSTFEEIKAELNAAEVSHVKAA